MEDWSFTHDGSTGELGLQTHKTWLFLCSFKCKCVDPVGNEARVIQIDIFYTNLVCICPLPRMLALVY